MSSKRSIRNQQYEKYWALTLEYTSYTEAFFNRCLEIIVDFIDDNNLIDNTITQEQYQELQDLVYAFNPKRDYGSVRKSINQFLKLGFINNTFHGYHKKTKEFLATSEKSRKKRIYSEILYDNASFSRSYKEYSTFNEIHFLVKTLEYCGSINKDELIAIMFVTDEQRLAKGYLTLDELKEISLEAVDAKLVERKYNQRNYFFNICKNVLTGIYFVDNILTLDEPDYTREQAIKTGRDLYKHRLYKEDLYAESLRLNTVVQCFYEKLRYPILVASHIKPYKDCELSEQFDVDNGLLLSKNIDLLFDTGWITFSDDGHVICAENLDRQIVENILKKDLDIQYLNPKRKRYLKYHREHVFDKDKQYRF